MRQFFSKSRVVAFRFTVLLGLLMVSYQNCSSGVSFQAADEILAQSVGETENTEPMNPAGSSGQDADSLPVSPGGGSTTPSSCVTPKVSVGSSCVCPAGSNDIGNTCLICPANQVFNSMTLSCGRLAVVCDPGMTYDGHQCVATSPACDAYVEVTSSKFAIPPRGMNANGGGKICYYVKLVSKVTKANSSNFPLRRDDIVSRLHGGSGNAAPHVMASREISFILQGDREVILAGDSHGGDDIYVDNYFLIEVLFPGLVKPNLWASGTADSVPHDGTGYGPIWVNSQPVLNWHAFGASGTSTFRPINMYNQLTENKEISFKGSALDCGSVGESSDVYLLFR